MRPLFWAKEPVRLDGDVAAAADGAAHGGGGEGRGVVDAVAHHHHLAALRLEPLHHAGLLLWQHLGDDFVHTHQGTDVLRRRPVVAGQQHGPDALPAHFLDGGGAGLFHRIGHRDQAQQGAAPGEVHGGLALGGEALRIRCQRGDVHAVLLQQSAVAGQDGLAAQHGL